MKAKDGNTLGAELVETHEAVHRMQVILEDMPSMSKNDRKNAMKELMHYYQVTGMMVR